MESEVVFMSRATKFIISENVRKYMSEKNISQNTLKSYIGGATLNIILNPKNSKYGPTIGTLDTLAEALDIKVIDLIEDWSEDD